MKAPLVKAPYSLNRDTRALIQVSVTGSLQTLGEEEYLYIGERIGPKLEALHGSTTHWVRDLWTVAAAFHAALRDHAEGNLALSISVRRHLAVGLHYLVNPFDVIPDHIYGVGYADDAAVLNYCAAEVARQEPSLLSTYMRRARRASGHTSCP